MTAGVHGCNDTTVTETEIQVCPCQGFRTIQDIRSALDSDEQTNVLVAWLSEQNNASSRRRLSCHTAPGQHHCIHRVSSAFIVLNAIRHACGHHLESSTVQNEATAQPSYEEAFPSLGSVAPSSPNVLVGRRKETRSKLTAESPRKDKPKTKRRIRPAPASQSSTTASAWSSSSQPPSFQGNISALPSESPLLLRHPNARKVVKTGQKSVKRLTPTTTPATPGRPRGAWTNSTHPSSGDSKPFTASLEGPRQNPNQVKLEEGGKDTRTPKVESTGKNDEVNGKLMERQRQHLADVYSTIIRHHLVPSTALELHLLIRLLTVQGHLRVPTNDDEALSSLFPTGPECQTFAIHVLRGVKVVLRNLGFDLVKALVECPPFRDMLPELTEDLKSVVESMRRVSFLNGAPNSSSSGVGDTQTPMLTLPFDYDRDSRHNYKTREASGLYKNREESRDAFLYQLRAFQNVRGRVLDAVRAEQSLQKIRLASKDVVQGILTANMLWFSQLFCDLLLQIGLVPMEETDKEILDITDKDKLQKLHRRFSSKEGKLNKSSKKLLFEPKNHNVASPSSLAQPQQFFPGHQEFFFIFMQSADSYRFGVQLKRRLVGLLSSFSASVDAKGLEQRLLKMQLLARFLGVLVFSPGWYQEPQGSQGLNSVVTANSSDDVDLVQPVLPFDRFIETAWKEGHMVLVIPWVVEFLRMLRWDSLSQSTSYYQRLFALLRIIQEANGFDENGSFGFEQSNMQLVSFYLESLFSDVVGLGRLSLLSTVKLPARKTLAERGVDKENVDTTQLVFSKTLLFASNPHLDELFALVTTLKQSKRSVTDVGVSPRKMRPYALSGSTNGISSLSFSETYSAEMPQVADSAVAKLSFDETSQSRDSGRAAFQRKLVDAFFHQHKDLKELLDFVVDRSLRNIARTLPSRCILPAIEKDLSSIPNQSKDSVASSVSINFDLVEQDLLVESRSFWRETVEKNMREAIALLGPPNVTAKVTEVAVSLALAHALRLGDTLIKTLVHEEMKKRRDARMRMGRGRVVATEGDENTKDDPLLEAAIGSLDRLAGALVDRQRSEPGAFKLLEMVCDAKNTLSSWLSERVGHAESTPSLHSSISKLDPCGPCFVSVLESCVSQSSAVGMASWPLAFGLTELSVLLSKAQLSRRVVKNVANLLRRDEQLLEQLVDLGIKTQDSTVGIESLGQLLLEMVQVKLIDMTQLERVLLYSMNELDPSGVLSRFCLEKLSETSVDQESSAVILPRLCTELKGKSLAEPN